MSDAELEECAALISGREPDFYGRDGAPIWCVGEPTLQEIRQLMEIEGGLRPSPAMQERMQKAMGRPRARKKASR